MILYIGNPKYATKKLVVFINEYKFYDQCQVAGYKINTHKSVAYIYICLFAFSWAAPMAYGGSQAKGQIGTAAAGLCHRNEGIQAMSVTYTTAHGNAGSLTY